MTTSGWADPFGRRLAAIFAAAVVLRLAIRLWTGTDGYWNDGYTLYADLADSLAAGHGYGFGPGAPTAFRVPLYPLFITAVTAGTRQAWLLILGQAVLSGGVAVFGGLIARRCFGPAAGLVAAAWCAAYPYYAWHHLSLIESGLFAFLTAGATWLLLILRERMTAGVAIACGVSLGAAILTRSMLAPFAVLALTWLLLPGPWPFARRLVGTAICAAALLTTLAPWLVRSHQLTGAYSLGTETGQSLYAGAHPGLFSDFPERSVDVSRTRIFAAIAPAARAERDRFSGGNLARESEWYTARAWQLIGADPTGYAQRAMRKLAIAFGPLPAPRHGILGNAGYAAWWVPLLVLAMVGAWRERRNWVLLSLVGAHLAGFAVVTMLVWAQTSHRSYLDVYLMVLASPVLVRLLPGRWRAWLDR